MAGDRRKPIGPEAPRWSGRNTGRIGVGGHISPSPGQQAGPVGRTYSPGIESSRGTTTVPRYQRPAASPAWGFPISTYWQWRSEKQDERMFVTGTIPGGSVLLGFTAPTGKFASEMSFPETADTPLLRGYRQRRARVQHGRHSWSTSAYPMPGDEMPQAMSRTIVCIRVTVSVDATGYCDDLRRLRIELI